MKKLVSLCKRLGPLSTQGHTPELGINKLLKYIGPGLLVTVGFIDPGNWASNIAAGSDFGYRLLWVISLSTFMLIVLQHNVAHLGIATGLCLAESATTHTPKWISRTVLSSAMAASVSTSLAEILGGAIALQMLFHIPIFVGAILVICVVLFLLFTNSYGAIEKIIIGFVSLIGFSFLYELLLVKVDWGQAAMGWITPTLPDGSMLIVMSVLGAVVMPHNLFLHSEVIQGRQWNLESDEILKTQLDYEFFDTLFSMLIGWAINSAMLILAASVFYAARTSVSELEQAHSLLVPLVGNNASIIFATALLFSGIASTVTSGMAGASIFAGIFGEPYDLKDLHSRLGILISLLVAFLLLLLIRDTFKALIISQMFLSVQLPFTIFLQIYLTSSKKIMGKHVNSKMTTLLLLAIGIFVSGLNLLLLISFFKGDSVL